MPLQKVQEHVRNAQYSYAPADVPVSHPGAPGAFGGVDAATVDVILSVVSIGIFAVIIFGAMIFGTIKGTQIVLFKRRMRRFEKLYKKAAEGSVRHIDILTFDHRGAPVLVSFEEKSEAGAWEARIKSV